MIGSVTFTPSRGVLIRLFLAEGVSDGLWIVEKSNWTGVGLMCPRASYPRARSRDELTRPGVYVLVGPSETGGDRSRVYIGEADVLSKRLDQHFASKDFWTRAMVFTSKDQNLNKAHVRYLEARLVRGCQFGPQVAQGGSGLDRRNFAGTSDRACEDNESLGCLRGSRG